ncbi:MAG: DUF1553 domain-containing protein [Planctomycetota bacterium]|jgi:hypothetical protein
MFARLILPSAGLVLAGLLSATQAQPPVGKVDFDRDIRPILSDRCYLCHGPDAATREADLRLDLREEALGVLSPGAPDESELLRRIMSDDSDEIMPPPDSNLSLSQRERQLIAAWIKQGAEWKQHWAFAPRSKPAPPDVRSKALVASEIDRFLLSRLEKQQLSYAPLATKEKLIRRVMFDLTGLPPTLDEIDAFLADDSPQAFEKVVDRLLESDHYGQRMASDWLDIARYSDTYGYQVDRDRFVWPWRDWVIRAFNANMPYDQFIVEQLAGDLLPNATDDQVLATTFNRLHPQKVEGGSTEEEFRVEYVADRTQTFATAFLGLTMECARCHDHKYDPISQKEYYQLFSFFNNIDESGLYSYFTNSVPTPTLPLTSEDQKQKLAELQAEVDSIAGQAPETSFDLTSLDAVSKALEVLGKPPVEVVDFSKVGGRNTKITDARGNPAVQLTGDDAVGLKTGNFTRYQPFSVSLSIHVPDVKERAVVFHRSRAWTDAGSRGYQLLIEDGRLSASLVHFWPGNALSVKTREQLPVKRWTDIAVVYDGSVDASGLSIFVDGKRAAVDIVKNHLTKNITGGGGDNIAIGARFRDRGLTDGQVSSFRVYDRQLSEMEVAVLHDEEAKLKSFQEAMASGGLSKPQEQVVVEHLRLNRSEEHNAHRARLKAAREQLCKLLDGLTEIMAMRELPEPKPAYILRRGLYSDRLEEVTAESPAVFPAMDGSLPKNRLGLARWLTSPEHPLTARVAVNHFWQLIFGQGLVRTPEDFGRQGALPTHPELLDWLANDFVANGWDVQRLLKQMVMSRAYRQSTSASTELLQRDPANELLARAPAYRLPAEMLRDNVLAVSGLLVDKIGGAPVRPYELAASFKASTPSKGEGLYRRSLYTYWKRTGPAPVMLALDAAKRDVCRVKRERTSSPLQALAMLNGPQFVEASRALSQRLIHEHGKDETDGIAIDMFRTLTSRAPSDAERSIITKLFKGQQEHFLESPESAVKYLSNGEFGSYRSSTGKSSAGEIQWPANDHDFRLGSSPSGTEKFTGEFGRASLFPTELSGEQIAELWKLGRDKPAPPSLSAAVANQKPTHNLKAIDAAGRGHVVFEGTSKLKFDQGFTLEAWIKPDASRSGRIWDKITPGKGDGLLLDLVGGIRLICGKTVVIANHTPPAGQWSHLACSVNLTTGRVRFFLNGKPAGGTDLDTQQMSDTDLATLAAWSSVANTLINHDECVTKR